MAAQEQIRHTFAIERTTGPGVVKSANELAQVDFTLELRDETRELIAIVADCVVKDEGGGTECDEIPRNQTLVQIHSADKNRHTSFASLGLNGQDEFRIGQILTKAPVSTAGELQEDVDALFSENPYINVVIKAVRREMS